MRSVWKFPLDVNQKGLATVDMPFDASVLHVKTQHGRMTVWALVDPKALLVPRTFAVRATGQEFAEEYLAYIGTVHDSAFVWHIFEVPHV